MPRKIRQLRADLKREGFLLARKRGKGSHEWYIHPKLPGFAIELSGHDGADAKPYQEKAVREALERLRKAQEER